MEESIGQFVWTPGESGKFRGCPRAYYLRAVAPEPDDELVRLRTLVPLAQWGRQIIAETLAFALSQYCADGKFPVYAELCAHATDQLRVQWRQSKSNIGADVPSGLLLAEHYFDREGIGIARETTDALKTSIEDALSGFVSSGVVEELATLSREALLMHDLQARIMFDCDGVKMPAQFDSGVIYRDSAGKTHIVAWHTGGEDRELASYAMACRIFYAMSHWKLPLDALVPEAVLLNDGGRRRGYFFTQENLKNIAAQIKSEMRMMRGLGTAPEAYPATNDSERCAQCLFRAYCGR
jgi:hypothetical protein